MDRNQAIEYVGHVVDDALNGRRIGSDQFAIVKENSTLIGWQCGFEPMFVSVHSYLPNVTIDTEEAIELAINYLKEINWFGETFGDNLQPEYVIEGKQNVS